MITCKECKFWARSTDPNNVPESLGACNKGKFVYQNPYWLLEYNDDYLPIGDNTQKDAAYYWDAESYRAGIVTGEDFGCIHARPLKPKTAPNYECNDCKFWTKNDLNIDGVCQLMESGTGPLFTCKEWEHVDNG